ncbi:hypothetical protein SEA_NIGHTMARE_79 [Arthrobacter phage Nightmare]|uniref:Uncharacterized protein n=1 Tax=Arthrobacter phage Nightmare TaxID=2015864 RepID=A0A221J6M4_9CAUD|nr:hypothetical protein QCN33_gp79 [Arthrobacter phage Nightmare]ASM62352.1 hypothetical protein SEA_NIGHTMARE_79 [Arthrobacter phage Nightmare]
MRINFYTVVKYFWVVAFVVTMFSFMLDDWDLKHLVRGAFAVVMIIIFVIVDAYHKDQKKLVK